MTVYRTMFIQDPAETILAADAGSSVRLIPILIRGARQSSQPGGIAVNIAAVYADALHEHYLKFAA